LIETVHTWRVEHKAGDGVDDSILSEDERDRASRYYSEVHRRRYVHFRTALRKLLGAYLSCAPSSISFEYDYYGKPAIEPPSDPRVHFNVSHSDDVALICISRRFAPGVDVERVRELSDLEQLAARIMSESELARFHELPPAMRSRAFFSAWTQKEAVLKAQGVGLSGSMPAIEVSMDRSLALAFERAGETILSSWRVWPLNAGAEYEASLAVQADVEVDVIERIYTRDAV